MANNDSAVSQTRFNTATQILEYAVGGNWVTVPGVGSSITAGEINSESATIGQVLTADGAGGASFENVSATPAGASGTIQYNDSGAFAGSNNLLWTDGSLTLNIGDGLLQYSNPGFQIAGGENDFIWIFTHFTNGMYIPDNPTGSDTIGVGTQTPADCAIMDLTSVNHNTGLLLPRLTTVERDAIATPLAGLLIYNTTTNKLNVYTTVWEVVTSA